MSLLAAVAAIAIGHAQNEPNAVIWRDYKSGAYSKATEVGTFEISTLAEFQRYCNQMGPEGAGDGHDVQWGKEELIAIHIGTRNAGGFSVEVDKIEKVKPTETRVEWTEVTPRHESPRNQAVTSPWTIVRMNRTGAHVTFAGGRREARLPGGIRVIGYPGYEQPCTCCEACIRANQDKLPWRTFASGFDAPVLLNCTYVMNSPEDYAAYVHNYRMDGLGDGSGIDWNHERLLAIHLGRKIAAGYQIAIDRVTIVDDQRVDVSYVQIEPTGVLSGGGSAGPYLIMRIPRVGSQVTFSKRVARGPDLIQPASCCGCAECRCKGG